MLLNLVVCAQLIAHLASMHYPARLVPLNSSSFIMQALEILFVLQFVPQLIIQMVVDGAKNAYQHAHPAALAHLA